MAYPFSSWFLVVQAPGDRLGVGGQGTPRWWGVHVKRLWTWEKKQQECGSTNKNTGIQWLNQRNGRRPQREDLLYHSIVTIASSLGRHTFARTDERCPWRSSWQMQWMEKMARWRDYLPSSLHLRTLRWPMLWADTWNVYYTVPSKVGIFTVHLFPIKHVSFSNQTCRWVDIIKDKVLRLWHLKKSRFWSSKWSSCI